jgi:BRCT domain type II-containing protein
MARKNERTDSIVVAEVMEAGADSKHLRGKSFSITGHLGKRREDVVALIEQAGGRFDKTPAWNTTYLITNADWSAATVSPGASKKFEAARRNGTKILSEQQFLDLLMKEPPASG